MRSMRGDLHILYLCHALWQLPLCYEAEIGEHWNIAELRLLTGVSMADGMRERCHPLVEPLIACVPVKDYQHEVKDVALSREQPISWRPSSYNIILPR